MILTLTITRDATTHGPQGKKYDLMAYEEYSNAWLEKFRRSKLCADVAGRGAQGPDGKLSLSEAQLEQCYWRVVQYGASEVIVDYGSDLDLKTFPLKKKKKKKKEKKEKKNEFSPS